MFQLALAYMGVNCLFVLHFSSHLIMKRMGSRVGGRHGHRVLETIGVSLML